ncbi:MAG: glycosyltransferase [Deltaproteobacteria bacterium]|nr:glycosyltransferase [Deltaproteobacteria bacterium]
MLGVPVRDANSGFRAYTKNALALIDPGSLVSAGPSIVHEVLLRAHRRGLRIVEVPILFIDRREGESELSLGRLLNGFPWSGASAFVRSAAVFGRRMPKPEVDVIVGSRDGKEHLARCLEFVYAQEYDGPIHTHVVDNDSRDASSFLVNSRYPQVRLTSNKDNVGRAGAYNQALAKARGRYVIFLSQDVEIAKTSSRRMSNLSPKPKAWRDCPRAFCCAATPPKPARLIPSASRSKDRFRYGSITKSR